MAESFFHNLKVELIKGKVCDTQIETKMVFLIRLKYFIIGYTSISISTTSAQMSMRKN